jgi:hypothetical protein
LTGQPQMPAAADLNGDGSVDLAVPNFYSNTVSVLLNLPVIAVSPNTVAFGRFDAIAVSR